MVFKIRPDTPQKYEFISVENIDGYAYSLIYVKPWKQFFDLKGRKDVPLSLCENIGLKNIKLKCEVFFDVSPGEYDKLSKFKFENLNITAKNDDFDKAVVQGFMLTNVKVNEKMIK